MPQLFKHYENLSTICRAAEQIIDSKKIKYENLPLNEKKHVDTGILKALERYYCMNIRNEYVDSDDEESYFKSKPLSNADRSNIAGSLMMCCDHLYATDDKG